MGVFTENTIKITPFGCGYLLGAADFAKAVGQICWMAESSHWPPRRRTKVHISSASSPRFPCRTGKNREKIESGLVSRSCPHREKTFPSNT